MTVDMEKYEELLQQIGGISQNHITAKALEELKEKYKTHINSNRVLEQIVDICCLLKWLKKRGVLQYNDIKVLKDINSTEYLRDETVKQQIRDLINDYEQWLSANCGSINIYYNSGKSNVLLTSHELNVPKNSFRVSESTCLYNNIAKNVQTSTEDISKESLLANESSISIKRSENENDTVENSFVVINSKICPVNINLKGAIVFMILIFILIGIIWILLKLPHESSAIAPGHPSQAAAGQSNMPVYMANASASYSTQSTFSVNHSQIYTTTPTVPPVDRERELQKIIVKDLSKKIGIYWKDVCRSLDIDENTIDEITIEYAQEQPGQKYEKMFKKGLTLYFSEPRPRWRIDLVRALRNARRVDLQERVEELIGIHTNL